MNFFRVTVILLRNRITSFINKFAFDAALPLYQFLGYDLSKIKLVSANLAQQDVSSSLVVLTPGFSSNYPTLFTKISSSPLLPTLIGTYIPYDWSILPSFQQSTPLIYTGPLENYYSQPSDKTHNTSHLCSSPIQHDSTTSLYLVLNIQVSPGFPFLMVITLVLLVRKFITTRVFMPVMG